MKSASYRHHRPFVSAASILRPRTRSNAERHNERLIRGAFLGSYQALAETFRAPSGIFAADLPLFDRDLATAYVERFCEGARDRALESFTAVLVPVANLGAQVGSAQAAHSGMARVLKAGDSAATADNAGPGAGVLSRRRRRGNATVTNLYGHDFYTPQVPPRRELLRIPAPGIDILPATGGRSRFTGVAQSHLDAVGSLPLDLVTLIDDGQKDGIQFALDEAIRRGYDPDLVGMEIANMVGLFPRWQMAVLNLQAKMEADARPKREIAYRVSRYSDWLRERRGLMIARTELMTAMNTGRMAGWHQDADRGFLDPATSIKEWLASPDSCDLCQALNGTQVTGIDSLFDAGQFGLVRSGPCHPHCRCTVLVHPIRRADQYLDPATT